MRPRIFLEGNFFVDLSPGSPSAPEMEDGGDPIPMNQTSAPVQFGDLLAALQTDTRVGPPGLPEGVLEGPRGQGRARLQRVAALRRGRVQERRDREPGDARPRAHPRRPAPAQGPAEDLRRAGRGRGGAEGPGHQLQHHRRRLRPRGRGARGLDPGAARRAARRLARAGVAELRAAVAARRSRSTHCPGVRSSGPTLEAALPFIRQARALVGPRELAGRRARAAAPAAQPREPQRGASCRSSAQARLLSSCTTDVLVPFAKAPIPNPDEPGNNNQPFFRQVRARLRRACRARAASRDGNNSFFHTSAVALGPERAAGSAARRRHPAARRGVPTCRARPRSRRT